MHQVRNLVVSATSLSDEDGHNDKQDININLLEKKGFTQSVVGMMERWLFERLSEGKYYEQPDIDIDSENLYTAVETEQVQESLPSDRKMKNKKSELLQEEKPEIPKQKRIVGSSVVGSSIILSSGKPYRRFKKI